MRPPEPMDRSRARELAQVRPTVASVPAAWMQSMKASGIVFGANSA